MKNRGMALVTGAVMSMTMVLMSGCAGAPAGESGGAGTGTAEASVKAATLDAAEEADDGNATASLENREDAEVAAAADDKIDWKQIYYEYLMKSREENPELFEYGGRQYGFIYVNDDDIPELVMSSGAEAAGNQVAGIFHGEVKTFQTARLGLQYQERGNIIDNSDGHMGYYYDFLTRMGEDDWKDAAVGEYSITNEEAFYTMNDYSVLKWVWNDEEITKEEYQENLEELIHPDEALSWEAGMTWDAVISYLSSRGDGRSDAEVLADLVAGGTFEDMYGSEAYDRFALLGWSDSETPALLASDGERFAVITCEDGLLFCGPYTYFSDNADDAVACYSGTGLIWDLNIYSDGNGGPQTIMESWYTMKKGSLLRLGTTSSEPATDMDGAYVLDENGEAELQYFAGNAFMENLDGYKNRKKIMAERVKGSEPIYITRDGILIEERLRPYLSAEEAVTRLKELQ